MFRKRVKLQASGSSDASSKDNGHTSIEKSRRRNKVKILQSYDDNDEQEDGPDVTLRKKTKKTIRYTAVLDTPIKDEEEEYKHDIPFSTDTKPQIMNLEDIDDDDGDDDENENNELHGIPSNIEIERIRRQRAILQQTSNTTGTGFYNSAHKPPLEYNEREYVKLLNKEDKNDLLEVIGDRSRDTEDHDAPVDVTQGVFEDARLALSKEELRRDESERRQEIINALDEVQNDQWEAQQVNKMEKGSKITSLPLLHEDDLALEALISELQNIALTAQNKRKIMCAQKRSLKAELDELTQQQQALVSRLERISSE
ncbi:LANO_0D08350g1_1 [Lachancea nothofagi CBS 11611]|uniref:LANO_0D08350g1_1 n=1 Tax=Lachancea nothofagi CBS 11611 TaxID=1266666 RepID=A0A1G4JIP0_9SACH|nr:LANO_0D08350g1_1 [Lachancea nothofagi CBS 11611]